MRHLLKFKSHCLSSTLTNKKLTMSNLKQTYFGELPNQLSQQKFLATDFWLEQLTLVRSPATIALARPLFELVFGQAHILLVAPRASTSRREKLERYHLWFSPQNRLPLVRSFPKGHQPMHLCLPQFWSAKPRSISNHPNLTMCS